MNLEQMKTKTCHKSMASGHPVNCVGDACMACSIFKFSDEKEFSYSCKLIH